MTIAGFRRWKSVAVLGLSTAAFLLASGCGSSGPEMAAVSGKVTYQGKPLEKGTISFVPVDPDKAAAHGVLGPGGAYELQTREPGDGAEVGDYRVAITDIDPESLNTELPGEPVKLPKSAIPKKYQDANTSGLTAKVESGRNTKDFNLE